MEPTTPGYDWRLALPVSTGDADSGYYAPAASLIGNYKWNTSQNNVVVGVTGDPTGWSAALSNPAVKSVTNCSIFAGSGAAATATNPAGATADGIAEVREIGGGWRRLIAYGTTSSNLPNLL